MQQMAREGRNNSEIMRAAPPTSALGQLNALAESIQTRRPDLTPAKCFEMALRQNPGLYEAYLTERGGQ
jgi:hypothetical protein